MLPYKRFATANLLAFAANYLHSSDETYRSVVRHEQSMIGYPTETTVRPEAPSDTATLDDDAEIDPHHQAIVSPSLPWRFIGWLGSLSWALNRAREMLLESNPNSTCHRTIGSVDPFKARSDQRMATLETARELLRVIPEWEACFKRPFFPQFATRSGFD